MELGGGLWEMDGRPVTFDTKDFLLRRFPLKVATNVQKYREG